MICSEDGNSIAQILTRDVFLYPTLTGGRHTAGGLSAKALSYERCTSKLSQGVEIRSARSATNQQLAPVRF